MYLFLLSLELYHVLFSSLCFLFLVCFILKGRRAKLVTVTPKCPEAGVIQLAFCISILLFRDNTVDDFC